LGAKKLRPEKETVEGANPILRKTRAGRGEEGRGKPSKKKGKGQILDAQKRKSRHATRGGPSTLTVLLKELKKGGRASTTGPKKV